MKLIDITNKKGTALLVALLVMGVLIAISLALSSLILRETRLTKDLLDSGRAYYAAESGIELALYGLNSNLSGWEPQVGDSGYKSFEIGENFDAVGEFKVNNRCSAYPCFEDFDVKSVPEGKEKVFYDVLDLNESINIPLFIVEDDGTGKDIGNTVVDVADVVVEFFASFNPQTDLNISGPALSGWDVLRWKIFGINKSQNVTETISDFTALSMLNNSEDNTSFSTNALNPSWFGTMSCHENLTNAQRDSRYSDLIGCVPYVTKDLIEIDPREFGQVSKIYAGVCSQSEAREYYAYNYYGDERKLESENIYGCYSIKQFLDDHKLNYLSLTNLINPAVFNPELPADKKEAFSKLFFRVELFGDGDEGGGTVREFADITSNGYSGNNKQSINVKIRRGSFMPVFHFSLYSTYMNEEAGHGEEYWYGEENVNIDKFNKS